MSTGATLEGFVGRTPELAALERQHQRERAAFVPVYGRRRVGKTELLLRFCAGKRAIYFAATQGAAPQQLRSFMRAAAAALGKSLLAEIEPRDWEHALALVAEHRGSTGRLILVLDEFQWLCESSPQLPSVLQKLWDHRWQKERGFMLILCGSYVGFMEREVLGAKSPLFGRRTGQLKLEALTAREAGDFFPRWSLEDRARAWFICGGIPAYLKAFDADRSVEQNIISAFLEVDAPLMREAEFLLREELRDVGSYATLVEGLAQGHTTPTTLSKFARIPVPRVIFFLKTLLELGYADRREPLVPGKPSRKMARYAVVDPVLRFWFRFVAPNFSAIRRGPPRAAFAQLMAPQLEAFYGAGFEALCREALPRLLEREGIDGNVRVGEFWDPSAQIDVVALRADRWTLLGECKWGTVASLPKLEAELRAKAGAYPLGTTTLDARVFVRRPLKGKAPSGVKVHALPDLYR